MSAPLLPDDLWNLIGPMLPSVVARPKGGRPRLPDRACLTGILFVLRSGIPWEMLPQELGCVNTTAVITGLGVGGIAIAFAAQKTIENLFGTITIVAKELATPNKMPMAPPILVRHCPPLLG